MLTCCCFPLCLFPCVHLPPQISSKDLQLYSQSSNKHLQNNSHQSSSSTSQHSTPKSPSQQQQPVLLSLFTSTRLPHQLIRTGFSSSHTASQAVRCRPASCSRTAHKPLAFAHTPPGCSRAAPLRPRAAPHGPAPASAFASASPLRVCAGCTRRPAQASRVDRASRACTGRPARLARRAESSGDRAAPVGT